jgi:hypothetical protein
MSTLSRRASCAYPVSDEWLMTTDPDAPEYVDIDEIRLEAKPGHPQSAYLTWVLKHDPHVFTKLDGDAPTRGDHIAATMFIDNGIRVGESKGTGIGNDIKGVLKGMAIIVVNEYASGVDHPEAFRRFYRKGTTVNGLWFVGFNEA